MIVEMSPAGPAPPVRNNEPGKAARDDASRSSGAFAGVLVAAQGGFGRWAEIVSGRLNHEATPLAAETADARTQRVGQMQDEAAAEGRSGRGSRLDGGRGADADTAGPRSQRLALERASAERSVADRETNEAPARRLSGARQGQPAEGPARPATVDGADADRAGRAVRLGPDAGPEPRSPDAARAASGSDGRTAWTAARLSETGATARSATAPPLAAPTVERGSAGNPNTPAVRPVSEITAGRTGVESARAVSGSEQAGGVRGTAAPAGPGGSAAPARGQPASRAGTARAPDPERPGQANFERLVRSIRTNVTGDRGVARMRLDPPEMGWIRIETRVQGDGVQVFVQTETTAAGELLQGRSGELQAALEQHGLRIDRFELGPPPADDQTGGPQREGTEQHSAGDESSWAPAGGGADPGTGGQERPQGDLATGPAEVRDTEPAAETSVSAAPEARLDVQA